MAMKWYNELTSPRHKFKYIDIPTERGRVYGGSVRVYAPNEYGLVLDTVYEMTEILGDANGIIYQQALAQVLRDEKFKVLPKHQKMILARIEQ